MAGPRPISAELEALGDLRLDLEQLAAPVEVVADGDQQRLEPAKSIGLAEVVTGAELHRLGPRCPRWDSP